MSLRVPVILALALSTFVLAPTPARAQEVSSAPLPGLIELHRALASPTVAGSLPAPEVLRVGHAEVRPAAGAKLLVLEAAGHRCGWVLDGPATLVYRVEDRFSVPVARGNLKAASDLKFAEQEGALVITTPIRGAAVWEWQPTLPSGELSPPPSAALPEWLRERLEGQLGENPARDVLLDAFNGDHAYRWATFRRAGDELMIDSDARPAVRTEWLARWRKLPPNSGPYSGRFYTERLVTQPTGRSWWEPRAAEFATTRTEIKAVNTAGNDLSVTTRAVVRSLRDDLRLLAFSLARDLYDDDQRKREMRISRLTVDGQAVPFVHLDFSGLLIALPRALAKEESVTIEVEAAGDILIRPRGDNYFRLGNEHWYPQPARGAGREWSSFSVDAEVRSPFVPFAPGTVVKRERTATGNRVVTELEGPMEYAFLLGGRYTTTTHESDGRRVHVSTYATVKENEARKVAQLAAKVRGCLERWLGVEYPFDDLQLIEVNSWGWGQAPPGFVFLTQEAFLNAARAREEDEWGREIPALMTIGINDRVAHEVAHGWFPHVAKIPWFEENWLSESLSDYASAVCLAGDDREQKYYWKRHVRWWREYTNRLPAHGSIYLAEHVNDGERGLNSWAYLLYGKGPLVLHALRLELQKQAGGVEAGDQLFMTWIRSYVKNFTYKTGETRHLVAILEQMTGKPWQPWFERYVYGTETPVVD